MPIQIRQQAESGVNGLSLYTVPLLGNLLLLFFPHSGGVLGTIATPPGFSIVATLDNNDTGGSIFSKISDGTETRISYNDSPSLFTNDERVVLLEITGQAPTNPIEYVFQKYTTTAGVTSQISPTLIPSTTGSLPLVFFALYDKTNKESKSSQPFTSNWTRYGNIAQSGHSQYTPDFMVTEIASRNGLVNASDLVNGINVPCNFKNPGGSVNWVIATLAIKPAPLRVVTGYSVTTQSNVVPPLFYDGIVSPPITVTTLPIQDTTGASFNVIPSDNGAGGTFNPASVTLGGSVNSVDFTYTPKSPSPGSISLSFTNSGGLSNPANFAINSTVHTNKIFSTRLNHYIPVGINSIDKLSVLIFNSNQYVEPTVHSLRVADRQTSINGYYPQLYIPYQKIPVTGSLMVLFVFNYTGASNVITPPPGYSLKTRLEANGTYGGIALYTKVADVDDCEILATITEVISPVSFRVDNIDLIRKQYEYPIDSAIRLNDDIISLGFVENSFNPSVSDTNIVTAGTFGGRGNPYSPRTMPRVGDKIRRMGLLVTDTTFVNQQVVYLNIQGQYEDITNFKIATTTTPQISGGFVNSQKIYPTQLGELLIGAALAYDATTSSGYAYPPFSDPALGQNFYGGKTWLEFTGNSYNTVGTNNDIMVSNAGYRVEYSGTDDINNGVQFQYQVRPPGGPLNWVTFIASVKGKPSPPLLYKQFDYLLSNNSFGPDIYDFTKSCFGPDGRVYYVVIVNASYTNYIAATTTNGVSAGYTQNYPPDVAEQITSLVVGPDNNIWYSFYDFYNSATNTSPASAYYTGIGSLDVSGNFINRFNVANSNSIILNSITLGPDGNFWNATLSNQIPHVIILKRITVNGVVTDFIYDLSALNCKILSVQREILSDNVNYLYFRANINSNEVIVKFSLIDNSFVYFNTPLLQEPPIFVSYGITSNLALGPDGNIYYLGQYYSDFGSLVGKMTPAGVFTEFFLGQDYLEFTGAMTTLTVQADGKLWAWGDNSTMLMSIDLTGQVDQYWLGKNSTVSRGNLLSNHQGKEIYGISTQSGYSGLTKFAIPGSATVVVTSTVATNLQTSDSINAQSNFAPPCLVGIQGFILPDTNIPYESIITVIKSPKIAEGFKQTLRNKP